MASSLPRTRRWTSPCVSTMTQNQISRAQLLTQVQIWMPQYTQLRSQRMVKWSLWDRRSVRSRMFCLWYNLIKHFTIEERARSELGLPLESAGLVIRCSWLENRVQWCSLLTHKTIKPSKWAQTAFQTHWMLLHWRKIRRIHFKSQKNKRVM